MKKQQLALEIYLTLPEKERSQVADLMPGFRLLSRQNSSEKPQLADYSSALNEIKKYRNLKTDKARNPAVIYSLFHLLAAAVALIGGYISLSPALFFYALIGGWIIYNRSERYWQIRFNPVTVAYSTLLLSVASYAVMVLMIGSLSLEALTVKPTFMLILQAAVAAPLFEELFFRDYMFRILREHGPVTAVTVTSALFTVVHFGAGLLTFELIASYFTAGLLLGLLREFSRSLFYPVLTHAAVNATMLWL